MEDEMPIPKVVLYNGKIKVEWEKEYNIGAGLTNLGNTCFLNSVVQCLTYCPPIVNYLMLDNDHSSKCNASKDVNIVCMICILKSHMKRVIGKKGDIIQPLEVFNKLKSIATNFSYGQQEDAHEFLLYILDNLWKSCLLQNNICFKLDPASEKTTVINQIFGSYHRSQITCDVCKKKSNTFDHFMDFSLNIEKNLTSLQEALERYTISEILKQNNSYKCSNCKTKVMAHKKFTVYKEPNVAIFQLNRFEPNGNKITKQIRYPEKLNLRPYMSNPQGDPVWYHLNAVLVHCGPYCTSGHYYCYVRNSNMNWYKMDDEKVLPVKLSSVLRQIAYVLFYIKIEAPQDQMFKKCFDNQDSILKDPISNWSPYKMSAGNFKADDLVWVQVFESLHWPAKIAEPNEMNPSENIPHHYVYFFGTHKNEWVSDANIVLHSNEKNEQFQATEKSTALHDAFEEMKLEIVKRANILSQEKISLEKSSVIKLSSPVKLAIPPLRSVKTIIKPASVPLTRKLNNINNLKKINKLVKKAPQKRKRSNVFTDCKVVPTTSKDYDVLPSTSNHHGIGPSSSDNRMDSKNLAEMKPLIFELNLKGCKATSKKIGLLGLGKIGSIIAKNLLDSGHFLTIWNRSQEKCKKFVLDGAETSQFPADVIKKCDITFCCVSDEKALKDIVFGSKGVLEGFDVWNKKGYKGYVEMTSLDPRKSQEIGEQISKRCGKYLEAPALLSRRLNKLEYILIICAGDDNLFHDCIKCFYSAFSNAFYVGKMVGSASNMKVVLSMIMGTTLAALWETMSVLCQSKISLSKFIEFLYHGPLSCKTILKNTFDLIENDMAITAGFKSLQQDLNIASLQAEECSQPLVLTAAVNQHFVYAKQVDYSSFTAKYKEAIKEEETVENM